MIIGIGTDISENQRIGNILNKFNKKFLEKVFMPEEIEYCMKKNNPVPHLSARYALKEAFIKALGLKKPFGLSYKDVGISGKTGKKNLIVTGNLKNLYEKSGANHAHFSISHSNENSIACVILEKISA